MKQVMLQVVNHDPVFVDELSGLYYFFDVTWSDYQGPFTTEDDCRLMLKRYSETVLGVE